MASGSPQVLHLSNSGPGVLCCPVTNLDVSSIPLPLHPQDWYLGADEGLGLHGLRPSPGDLGVGPVLGLGKGRDSLHCVAWLALAVLVHPDG